MSHTGTPSLKVKDLSVTYGEFQALKSLSLSVKKGELVGVIGPNGAGKTSFIKALCGRVGSTGQIFVAGQPLKRGQDRRRKIGLVPQDIGLYPQLTARENLDVIARLLGVKSDKRVQGIEQALEAVGLTSKGSSLIQDLSGGMKRRINVAAAIMHDPAIVIFDEPTAGVDIPARDELHRLARRQAELGKAVILVTHELKEAETLCDKILLLLDGQKLAFDSALSILSQQFGKTRNVILRFASSPSPETLEAMRSFKFERSDSDEVWIATTRLSEPAFMTGLIETLKDQTDTVREISIRRPGLTALMHHVEAEKGLIV
ncbi:ABC transporter ATP-binding protein [Litorimonas haliclonae]|uniref:ABC transporter ATP-binding protein n=1 Tax=Litorimonas haliclonae TaxID=2081977 RepID=UPI0039EE8183